jgi:hypothetical protein
VSSGEHGSGTGQRDGETLPGDDSFVAHSRMFSQPITVVSLQLTRASLRIRADGPTPRFPLAYAAVLFACTPLISRG